MKYTDQSFQSLRYGRSGITCIICGLYFIIVLSKTYVQEYGTEVEDKEAYNGNIWYKKLWCRG